MGQEKGMLTTCNRCGTQVFSKFISRESVDGGYSHREKYEDLPEGWDTDRVKGVYTMLCPTCKKDWHKIGQAFLDRVPITIQGTGKRIDPAMIDDKTDSGILEE